MNTIELTTIIKAIVSELRPVVRQELQKAIAENEKCNDETIGIHEIARILGHSEDWCRRSQNKVYPHFYVGGEIKAHRNNLTRFARLNGFKGHDC